MEIKGNIHLMFEQSGTFKNEFKKLGYEAFCYDIQNNFGETDYQIDLFAEIESAYGGGNSVFDNITEDDLIMAFFPCIYFESLSMIAFTPQYYNYRKLTFHQTIDAILERTQKRSYFYGLILKLFAVVKEKGLRMIVENPANQPHYLLFPQNFIMEPTFIDKNRQMRGDYFKKPTAYWFVNCEPTDSHSYQTPKEKKLVKKAKMGARAGLCSEERSMISPDYARNFICDFILGKEQVGTQLSLF